MYLFSFLFKSHNTIKLNIIQITESGVENGWFHLRLNVRFIAHAHSVRIRILKTDTK